VISPSAWRHRFVILAVAIAAIAAVATIAPPQSGAAQGVEATGVWPAATPESQGLDSGVLAEMLEHVRARQLPVHSVLIVRHGRLVLDATVYPFESGRLHDIASATKSVTSILIGIALDKGLLTSVNQRVSEVLPLSAAAAFAESAKSDPRREQLTIEHLLTMTSGWHCGVEPGEKELAAMRRSDDWAAFALKLPMWAEPGSKYAYCSCNNHVLSAIISARTSDSALAFARRYLFGPLGIKDAIWPKDPMGRSHGWGDLLLKPHDLAKLGYLYLHGGRWNGTQIVSEEYVRQSIAPRVIVRKDEDAYGYGWWVNTARKPAIYEMVGRGGQRVAVLPDKELVIVFNGGGVDTDELAPFLLRAIKSDAPLPESPDHTKRLRIQLAEARRPPSASSPSNSTPLPELARKVSGQMYTVSETNPLNLQFLSLTFSGSKAAYVRLRFLGGEWSAPIGLDGRARFSSTGPSGQPMAAKGEWISPREFVLDLNTVANINHFVIHMQFDTERRVRLRIDEKTGEIKNLSLVGQAPLLH
jgi:CubicO group peptidase (beta-lactamase class C family)